MYAPYNDVAQPKGDRQKAGMLWGVQVLHATPFYYDDVARKHYTIDYKEGMCGREEIYTDLGTLEDGDVVDVGGEKYKARFARPTK